MNNKKLLIALSGGVDSSVAALLLTQAGYDCSGVMMRLLPDELGADPRCCGSAGDAEDAGAVCRKLGIPFNLLDFRGDFLTHVVEPFKREYLAGLTPNPCIECNRRLKFDALLRRAEFMGFGKIATGHYARIERCGGSYFLRKALDETKDQSYVLYMLTPETLPRVCLPLGGLTKARVRELAEENGFVNAKKRESQDICFVPDGDYVKFLGGAGEPGNFLLGGEVVRAHAGQARYTPGQRRGLGVAHSEPLYVKEKRGADVILACKRDMFENSVTVRDFNRIIPPGDLKNPALMTRYRGREIPVKSIEEDGGAVTFTFAEPAKISAPGQAAVLYDGDYVAGGGTIIRGDS